MNDIERDQYLEKYPLPNESEDEFMVVAAEEGPNGGMTILAWLNDDGLQQGFKEEARRRGMSDSELFQWILTRHI